MRASGTTVTQGVGITHSSAGSPVSSVATYQKQLPVSSRYAAVRYHSSHAVVHGFGRSSSLHSGWSFGRRSRAADSPGESRQARGFCRATSWPMAWTAA